VRSSATRWPAATCSRSTTGEGTATGSRWEAALAAADAAYTPRHDLAYILWRCASSPRQAEEADRVTALVSRGLAIVSRLDMRPLREALEALVPDGDRSPEPAGSAPCPVVTPRETQVLQLIAEGRTNGQIGKAIIYSHADHGHPRVKHPGQARRLHAHRGRLHSTPPGPPRLSIQKSDSPVRPCRIRRTFKSSDEYHARYHAREAVQEDRSSSAQTQGRCDVNQQPRKRAGHAAASKEARTPREPVTPQDPWRPREPEASPPQDSVPAPRHQAPGAGDAPVQPVSTAACDAPSRKQDWSLLFLTHPPSRTP
jgi:hypothetical protein